jgi:hypothetical protein
VEKTEQGWHPTSQEVAEILRELRPVIAKVAQRDHLQLAAALCGEDLRIA